VSLIRHGQRVTSLTGARHLDLRETLLGWNVVAVWPDGTEEQVGQFNTEPEAKAFWNHWSTRLGQGR